jgi:hypothetical protein
MTFSIAVHEFSMRIYVDESFSWERFAVLQAASRTSAITREIKKLLHKHGNFFCQNKRNWQRETNGIFYCYYTLFIAAELARLVVFWFSLQFSLIF